MHGYRDSNSHISLQTESEIVLESYFRQIIHLIEVKYLDMHTEAFLDDFPALYA